MGKPQKEFLSDAIYLIDASSYIFRAYYAVQTELLAPDGTPTHATHAFINMIRSFIKEHQVAKLALIWDRKEKGFRHEIFPEYKANRGAPPEDLSIQIENSQKVVELMGIPQMSAAGYEADDVIASIVDKFPKDPIVVVTSDKDLLQLVSETTWCLDTMKKKWSNREASVEKFGVEAAKIAEVQALCGDSVDNIPGAPGIGPKTASALIHDFETLENILNVAQERHEKRESKVKYTDSLKGKKIENIALHREQIEMSFKLVSLARDVPLELKKCHFLPQEKNYSDLHQEFQRLGFKRLAEECAQKLGHQNEELSIAQESPQKTQSYKTIVTPAQLKSILYKHIVCPVMALDTESFHLNSLEKENLVGFSFSFNEEEGFYVPLKHENYGKNLDPEKALTILYQFLEENRAQDFSVVFQNAKFDLQILESAGFPLSEKLRIEDTMIASYVLDSSEQHGMDALAQKYLNHYECIPFSSIVEKGQNFSHVSVDKATEYAAEDAIVTWRLWDLFSKKLKEEKLWDVYDKIDRPIIRILSRMERNGVYVYPPTLSELSERYQEELKKLDQEAREMLREYGLEGFAELNFASPKQIAKVLYEDLKLPVLKKGKTGPSTDVSVLEELSLQHPFPKMILEIRELSKLLSTYVDPLSKLINPHTQRLHAQFSQTTAQTGRFSSNNPNLQNIPIRTERGKKIRDAFRAQEDHVLVAADYSQVELRVLAHYSNDKNLLEAFEQGADIHKNTAAKLFEKALEEVSSDERRIAKTINFGIVFGQTAFGLSKTLGISRKEAQNFIDQYFVNFPGIQKYMEESIELTRENKRCQTITGRHRYIRDINSKNPHLKKFAERMAINSPIQGSAADIIKLAMIRLEDEIAQSALKARLVLQVHDELVYECPRDEAETVEKLIVQNLESQELLSDFEASLRVKMKADSSYGEHWGLL